MPTFKPVNVAILKGTSMNASRYAAIQRQMIAQNDELKQYFQTSEAENRAARDIMKRLLAIRASTRCRAAHRNSPAFKFSGDIVTAERSPTAPSRCCWPTASARA